MPDPLPDELLAEQAALERIQKVHKGHLERARAIAAKLAEDAVELTEDGIRDVYDEDAEADAAVAAALVRQTSAQAMHAVRRVAELEAMGDALSFGYTAGEGDDGEPWRLNVGRLSVIDGDEALLVDWRADAAVPFYRATPLDNLGVRQRRHLLYGDGVDTNANRLDGYSDEVFDLGVLDANTQLRGEAALLASVSAPTEEQMRSVVATIQAEQDAVIRAPSDKPLVVQGGPGTGKTVVALHRAAYLLYAQRANLSDSGVLIVGPTAEFLSYIRGVLPSLGETGVVSVTAAKLFPGVLVGLQEHPDVAEVKGRAVMADVLANAVGDRQRRPTAPLQVWYGAGRVVLRTDKLVQIFERSLGYQTYNEGAQAFRRDVVAALSTEVYDPSFRNVEDANETFSNSRDVERFLLRHWPPLTPEQALNDLLGSRGLLRSATRATSLTESEVTDLYRTRTSQADFETLRWSEADIPLLDELFSLMGGRGLNQVDERDVERDEADEFQVAVLVDDAEEEDDAELDDVDEAGLDDPWFGQRVFYQSEDGLGTVEPSLEDLEDVE
ncbi:MAG: hypothetical protein ACI8TP_001253 [Acidimicrobiales bacterium]|jgi:hypothetical protein